MMKTILTTSNSLHDYLNKWNNYIHINNTVPWCDDDEESPKLEMSKPVNCVPTQTRTSKILKSGFTIIQKKVKVRKNTKTPKITGKITKFIFSKGYGFIKSNKYNVPIFLHQSDITPNSVENLPKSTNAYFELQKDKNGRLVAKNCKIY
uniref:CSD domain-containing protein n=1 Tax=viral metagenome TaxID=1070528 RepID=A0A6C0L2C2_9ZZZZ